MIAILEVLAGAFVLFVIARGTYEPLVRRSGWLWVGLLFLLAVASMLIHRFMGNTINPPFYTALLFCMVLAGLSPKSAPSRLH